MSACVLVEVDGEELALVSAEAVTFARSFGGPVDVLVLGPAGAGVLQDCARYGVRTVYEATNPELSRYGGAAWAAALSAAVDACAADVVTACGTGRGNEVLAHLAATREVPMAANVVAVQSTLPLVLERQVVGGAALETVELASRPAVLSMAGHAVEPAPAQDPGEARVVPVTVDLTPDDLRAQVVRTEHREGGDTGDLTSAKVVVGAGRGAGSAEGFGDVERLAARLGGAVGVSRVVTSLGWRPHAEQVGQTGSRISPDLYLPCGISGAIQHWAGCQSSKTILAINTDPDAPMMTKADYAVVGDMHEVIPAILDELG